MPRHPLDGATPPTRPSSPSPPPAAGPPRPQPPAHTADRSAEGKPPPKATTPRRRSPPTSGPLAKGTTPRSPATIPAAADPTPKAPQHKPRSQFSALFPRHFCTHHQPPQAQADVTSRLKKPVLHVLQSRDKSQAPILRPSQRRFCASCVIPRRRQQSQFPPFYRLPDTF